MLACTSASTFMQQRRLAGKAPTKQWRRGKRDAVSGRPSNDSLQSRASGPHELVIRTHRKVQQGCMHAPRETPQAVRVGWWPGTTIIAHQMESHPPTGSAELVELCHANTVIILHDNDCVCNIGINSPRVIYNSNWCFMLVGIPSEKTCNSSWMYSLNIAPFQWHIFCMWQSE